MYEQWYMLCDTVNKLPITISVGRKKKSCYPRKETHDFFHRKIIKEGKYQTKV